MTRNDCAFIQSTYLDNPFLAQSIVSEIKRLKDEDDNYWKIYGLGERGQTKSVIYDNWVLLDDFPENQVDEIIYGVDFGFNKPSSLIKIGVKDEKNIFIEELLYERFLTNSDFIERLKTLILDKNKLIKADSAEPDRIEEIKRAGFYIEPARKGKNSVKDGIDTVKRKKLHIIKNSTNLIKEIRSYKWKEDKATGKILDEPVKFNDHAMDAIRYVVGDMDIKPEQEAKSADWDTSPDQ